MNHASLGTRLAELKANTPVKAGLVTFAVGALYCAHEAQRGGFTDRIDHPDRWRIEFQNALDAAADIGRSRSPSKSEWTAIVHFNSALMRIDVGFERAIKHIAGSRKRRFDGLCADARASGIPQSILSHWDKVRNREANALKHANPSALTKARLTYKEMLLALDALVTLLEGHL